MKLELPLTPTLNALLRMHWRKRGRLKRDYAWDLRSQLPPNFGPLSFPRVQVTRVACGVEPDGDNLAGGQKLVLDALTIAGVIEDDGPASIQLLPTKWARANTAAEQKTIIALDE